MRITTGIPTPAPEHRLWLYQLPAWLLSCAVAPCHMMRLVSVCVLQEQADQVHPEDGSVFQKWTGCLREGARG